MRWYKARRRRQIAEVKNACSDTAEHEPDLGYSSQVSQG